MNSSQLIYNVPISCTHIFQVNGSTIVSINASGLNIGSNLISSTVAGYINTCTFNLQTQLNNKLDKTGGSISS